MHGNLARGTHGLIRQATEKDLAALVTMCVRFHVVSGLRVPLDPGSLRASLARFASNPMAGLFVSGEPLTGVACVIVFPCWFNTSILEATELFWWVEPQARGMADGRDLLRAMESWAVGKGATTMQLGAMDVMHPKGLDRAYRRLGYEPKERYYVKRLA